MPAILAAADAALRGTLGTNTLNDGYLTAHAAATPDRMQIWHLGKAAPGWQLDQIQGSLQRATLHTSPAGHGAAQFMMGHITLDAHSSLVFPARLLDSAAGFGTDDTYQEATELAQELRRLHTLRGIPWGEMAILYRIFK